MPASASLCHGGRHCCYQLLFLPFSLLFSLLNFGCGRFSLLKFEFWNSFVFLLHNDITTVILSLCFLFSFILSYSSSASLSFSLVPSRPLSFSLVFSRPLALSRLLSPSLVFSRPLSPPLSGSLTTEICIDLFVFFLIYPSIRLSVKIRGYSTRGRD